MRETTPAAMPPGFDRWCKKFDDLLRTKAQKAVHPKGHKRPRVKGFLSKIKGLPAYTRTKKREFRHYLGGLLGESGRKNLYQMASDSVGVTYHKLHHCLDAVAHGGNPQDRAASLLN